MCIKSHQTESPIFKPNRTKLLPYHIGTHELRCISNYACRLTNKVKQQQLNETLKRHE